MERACLLLHGGLCPNQIPENGDWCDYSACRESECTFWNWGDRIANELTATAAAVRSETIEECKQVALRYEAHSAALVHLITDAFETLRALARDQPQKE
jgi:hypothetical protein